MAQQVFVLDTEDGKLVVAHQYIYGSKDVLTEDHLTGIVEKQRTVHFPSGPQKVTVLLEDDVYWIRKGDMP